MKMAARHANPERYRAQHNAWNRANAEKVRASRLRRQYGLTLAEYNRMLDKQHGFCAICPDKLTSPCVDHDHKTGKVRGLLCHKCNVAIGLLRESPAICASAESYLLNYGQA